jgi:photosystem II stability/assembly factor-like uncharacterized protein
MAVLDCREEEDTMTRNRNGFARYGGLAVAGMLLVATAVPAGTNTWSGSGPSAQEGRTIVASHPQDPDVVYAVFQPDLYRSGDGGRSWTRVGSFTRVHSLLVHPASPGSLYVGAENEVFRSSNGGGTWSRYPFGGAVTTLAGDPRDGSTVFAGTSGTSGRSLGGIYKTTDGGRTWTAEASLSEAVASLVIDPRNSEVVYAGTDTDSSYSYSYYYPLAFPSFIGSSDGGNTWRNLATGDPTRVSAIAVDPADSQRIYLGLESEFGDHLRGVFRSDSAGRSFSAVVGGLPPRTNVSSVVIDPADSATVYIGTNRGVYRSRDSGRRWFPIGQVLAHQPIQSLALSSDGLRVRAGTPFGAFELEIATGPIDVASGEGASSHVLSWNADRLSVQTLAGMAWASTPPEGPARGWSAIAVAGAEDRLSRVLWQNGDGRSALEILGTAGREAVALFEAEREWIPIDLSVGADGRARLLWSSARGAMRIALVEADGTLSRGPQYGPFSGWRAVAISDAPGGPTWVLWRSTDGRAGATRHIAGALTAVYVYAAIPEFTVEDIAVGSDGRARVLTTSSAGAMQVWTVQADGSRSVGAIEENPGLVPRRIAAGEDGLTRVLWSDGAGAGAVWVLDGETRVSTHEVPAGP